MKLNEIINKVAKGTFLVVCTENEGILGGQVEGKYHITDDGCNVDYYMIYITINKEHISLDTRIDYKVLKFIDIDGLDFMLKDTMEYYCMDIHKPVADIIHEIIQLWDAYDDKGKNDMSYILWKLTEEDDIKSIFEKINEDNKQILYLTEKLKEEKEKTEQDKKQVLYDELKRVALLLQESQS
ncbi:MAG: hypothetical protein E6124_00935 [Blautia producta]|nr:hypothetical protein [Blautia producta]MDU5380751.1 hypothetical protein [Blautia producta]MDU6882075.1 hypothetical protein [Blautia producta]